jgi:hypothetical protein
MGGAGRRDVVGTGLTERVTYREVTSIDADIDDFDDVIDTRYDGNDQSVSYGANGTLALYVILGGSATAATLQLYALGTDESEAGESSSSSPSGASSEWCFYEEFTVDTKNLLKQFVDLPAGEYKVMVTVLTGSGSVIIRNAFSV